MTVAATSRRAGPFAGDGAQVNFDFSFKCFATSDIVVTQTSAAGVETVKTLTTHYTVALNADQNVNPGGRVTMLVAPPVGEKITLSSAVPESQGTSLPNGGQWNAKVVENALDKATILVGQVRELLTRVLTYAISDTSTGKSLPTKAQRANMYLGFDVNGDPVAASSPTGGTVSAAMAPVVSAASVAAGRAALDVPSNSEAVLKTLVDAKGDIITATADNAPVRKAVGSEGAVLAADPAQSDGLQYVRLGAGSVRQSVLSAALDANGYNAALTTGAGLRPGLDAAPTPMALAFAAGFGPLGAQDMVSTLAADVADILGANLPANNTSFVHASWLTLNSVTWGQTLVPPQYGYAFDRTRGALLNFEAADATVAMIDDFGNTWTASGNAQIDTAQKQFGAASLLLDGAGDFIESTNFTTLGDGSWEMSCWFRLVGTTNGSISTLLAFENAAGFGALVGVDDAAGVRKIRMLLSSNGTTNDLASAGLGATVITLNAWWKVRLVFDALAGTYRTYLSAAGAAETQELTISSTTRICALTRARIGRTAQAGFADWNGWVDAARFLPCATNTTTEAPSAAAPLVTDYPVHFFSIPEMKMYEVTAASAVAGTNPTLTQRNRLFVGEADTSGAAVTAVRNYALKGQYRSALTPLPGGGTLTSFSSNLGVKAGVRALSRAVVMTAIQGYSVGSETDLIPYSDVAGNSYFIAGAFIKDRNTIQVQSGSQGFIALNITPGSPYTLAPANYNIYVDARRDW